LNDYYEADLDTYQSGKIAYALDDIAPGEHTLYLKVWDVFNNSSDGELTFTVVAQEDIAIEHLINYPNPFTTNTEFSFEHNQVCDYLDVQIQVFTITGTVVKTINQRIISNGFRVDKIQWDGRDDFGEKIGIGTYIYKLTVETESGENLEKFEKLVILN
jgi:flagellar hook assembly protein FlgD